jgi:hypothetical protein
VGSTSWIGEAKNEEQAGLNACNKYCRRGMGGTRSNAPAAEQS